MQNLLSALSKEQVVELTGLTIEKMNNIIMKSEKIEQKLLEGLSIVCNAQGQFEDVSIKNLFIWFFLHLAVNLRLVHSIALQHQGMGLELEDLVYEGNIIASQFDK